GAFGVGVGGGALLLRWAALAALRPGVLLLGGLWCLSRTGMAIVSRTQPYAPGPGGLAAAFEGPARLGLLGAGVAGAVGLAWRGRLAAGAAAAAAGLAAGSLVVLLARRRIGGYTGDVLGAFGVVAETAGLIVAAARWGAPRPRPAPWGWAPARGWASRRGAGTPAPASVRARNV